MTTAFAGLVLLVAAHSPQSQAPPDVQATSSEYVEYDYLRHRDRVESDWTVVRTLELRALLRTAAAVAELGQVESLYLDGYGDVEFEDVRIEKPDGRVVEVKNGLVEDLNPFGVTATALSADIRFKKLTIPGLEPGDWLSYRVVTRRKPIATGYVFGEADFEATVGNPVQTYELDLPRGADIRLKLREGLGTEWEMVASPPDSVVRRLTLQIEPPSPYAEVTVETLMAEVEPDVSFTSFPTWAAVGSWWWDISKDRLVPDDRVREEAERLATAQPSPRDKLEALHRFVASRIRYVNVSFGLGRMRPRAAGDVLTNRYGDCKDKHALLAAMASAVGIDVRPVLIHSVRPDLYDDVPAPQQFDHMISVARLGPEPEDWLWLDATSPFGVPGYLQPELRDQRALLIEPTGEGQIVRTPATLPFSARTEFEFTGILAPDATLAGSVVLRFRSDEEVILRATLAAATQEQRTQAFQAGFGRSWRGGTVSNVRISDPSDTAEPFEAWFEAERPRQPSQEKRRLQVPIPELLALPSAELLGAVPFETVVRAEVEIPDGMSARAPRSISIDRPFAAFESTYSIDGRQLSLTRALKVMRHPTEDELDSYETLQQSVAVDAGTYFTLLEHSAPSKPGTSPSPPRTQKLSVPLPMSTPGKSVTYTFPVDEGFFDATLSGIPEGVSLCMCLGNSAGCYPFCGHDTVLAGSISVSRMDKEWKPGDYKLSVYYYPPDAQRTRNVNPRLSITYSGLDSLPIDPVATKVRDTLEPLKGSRLYRADQPGVRAIVAMGREAVPELLAILGEVGYADSPKYLYGVAAAEALAQLATGEDLAVLTSLLADGHLHAARALERMNGPEVRGALLVPLGKGFADKGLTEALARFQDDPQVQEAVVAYLENFGEADDYVPGYVAELAGRAGMRAAIPVLTRLVEPARPGTPAQRMFAAALVALHEPVGVQVLVELFLNTTEGTVRDRLERHNIGVALNPVVGERVYIGSRDRPMQVSANFDEAAEAFRVWWSDAQETIHWDQELEKWAW